MAEDHKVGVRDSRRAALGMLKDLEGDGSIPQDDRRQGEKKVQGLTDEYVEKIDEAVAQKEKEILQV
jgi:ribosome recycling factor